MLHSSRLRNSCDINRTSIKRERGVVLLVALIMVLLMTIVALASIRGSGMQELMAGNMRDVHLRFQAAEAGLRVGESIVDFDLPYESLPTFDGSNPSFLPNQNIGNSKAVSAWRKDDWAGANAAVAMLDLEMPSRPRYVIEEIIVPALIENSSTGSGVDQGSMEKSEPGQRYRITAFYGDGGVGSGVYLQSLYKR